MAKFISVTKKRIHMEGDSRTPVVINFDHVVSMEQRDSHTALFFPDDSVSHIAETVSELLNKIDHHSFMARM